MENQKLFSEEYYKKLRLILKTKLNGRRSFKPKRHGQSPSRDMEQKQYDKQRNCNLWTRKQRNGYQITEVQIKDGVNKN